MAMHNKNSANMASSTPSNRSAQSTDINQSLFESHVFELDEDYYKDDANDPEILDPQSPEAEGYRAGTHDFQFEGLSRLIASHTAGFATTIGPNKPYNDCQSRKLHNEQQRTLWQRIREQAEKDDDLPTALFSPPRTYVEVRVSEWPNSDHYCCACDIEETDCEVIEIRAPKDSPDGITKDMFIQQVSDALYGRGPEADADSESDGYKIGGEDDRPVVENFDYMIGPGDGVKLMGHVFALTRGIVPNERA